MFRSPAKKRLEEWPLHKINLQVDTKQVSIINGVTARIDDKLG